MAKSIILIADDNRAFVNALAIRLRAAGFLVVCAQDGCQAVSMARKHVPDLMVLDIGMPAGDGFSVHERVRALDTADQRDMPVIYLTGDRSEAVKEKALEMRAHALVHKPCGAAYLIGVITEALENSLAPNGAEEPAR